MCSYLIYLKVITNHVRFYMLYVYSIMITTYIKKLQIDTSTVCLTISVCIDIKKYVHQITMS